MGEQWSERAPISKLGAGTGAALQIEELVMPCNYSTTMNNSIFNDVLFYIGWKIKHKNSVKITLERQINKRWPDFRGNSVKFLALAFE